MKHHHQFSLRTLRLFCLSVCSLFVFQFAMAQTQIGRMNVDQFPKDAYGTKIYGLTKLPSNYSSSSQTYPLIVYLHGVGETGTGVSGLNNLIKTSLPQYIANGWDPQATNPADGKTYQFIVVAPQAASWSYGFNELQYIIPNIMSRYRVDPARVYVTGISAGGAGVWSSVTNTQSFAQKIAAIVPVSAAGTENSTETSRIPLVGGTFGVKVWSICGESDSFWSLATSFTSMVNTASPAPSVSAGLTGFPNVAHTGASWNTAYNPTWRSNTYSKNVYEWMLQYTRGTSTSTGSTSSGSTTPTTSPSVSYLSLPGKVEAEQYASMSGVVPESTTDAGGGQDVGNIDNGEYMNYNVNPASTGTYTVSFRLATPRANASFQLKKSDGTVLATVKVPNTGGYQTWTTVNATVSLTAGNQTIKIQSTSTDRWNINWFQFATGSTTSSTTTTTTSTGTVSTANLSVSPNPISDKFTLTVNNNITGSMNVQVINASGVTVKTFYLQKSSTGAMQTYLSIGDLPTGYYILNVQMPQWYQQIKVSKQ